MANFLPKAGVLIRVGLGIRNLDRKGGEWEKGINGKRGNSSFYWGGLLVTGRVTVKRGRRKIRETSRGRKGSMGGGISARKGGGVKGGGSKESGEGIPPSLWEEKLTGEERSFLSWRKRSCS